MHKTKGGGGAVVDYKHRFLLQKFRPMVTPRLTPSPSQRVFLLKKFINSAKSKRVKGEFLTFQLSLHSTQFSNLFFFLSGL
jgi:hypothetical protein